MPYKFNGKEFDEETGLYYYGARYMNPVASVWYGIDSKFEKYPCFSGYCITAANPIILKDPDGNDIVLVGARKSSITIKTDLLNCKVSIASFGIDFHGNYTLSGEEFVSAALDIVGIVDPTGVADGINASLHLKNGNYFDAAISGMGFIPYVGDAAKAPRMFKSYRLLITKIQKHHIIPKAVYKRYEKKLTSIIMRDCGKNLKKLPNRFHGNHPAYSKWIEKKLEKLSNTKGGLTEEKINKLLDESKKEIYKAYENFKNTGGKENMNDYFKKLND